MPLSLATLILILSALIASWALAKAQGRHFNRGRAAALAGQDDLAIELFTKEITNHPQNAYAFDARGNAFGRKNDHERALADYQRAVDLEPRHAGILGNLGRCLYLLGRTDEALKVLNEAIDLDPDHSGNFAFRATARASQGDLAGAVEDYDRVLALTPEDHEARYARGRLLARSGDYSRAVTDLEHVIAHSAAHADAHYNLSYCLLRTGRPEAALEVANRGLALPDLDPVVSAHLHSVRGSSHISLNKPDEGLSDFRIAASLLPDDIDLAGQLGEHLIATSHTAEAIRVLSAALAIRGDTSLILGHLARAHVASGEATAAIDAYTRALSLDDALWLREGRGLAYSLAGKHAEALRDFDATIKGDASRVSAYVNRGRVHAAKGDVSAALSDFDRAIALDPKSVTAFEHRADAYLQLRRFAEAADDYTQLLQISPESWRGYMGRGIAHYELAKPHDALCDYNRALARNPGMPELFYDRALASERLGHHDQMVADATAYLEAAAPPKSVREKDCHAFAQFMTGRLDDALGEVEALLELHPDEVEAISTRARVLERLGRSSEAISEFRRALTLNPRPLLITEINEALARLSKETPGS